MSKLIWKPSDEIIKKANITKLINNINDSRSLQMENYHDLYNYSIDRVGDFWEDIWIYTGIIASKDYKSVVENIEEFPPDTKWFSGSELNFAENLLRFKDELTAFLFKSEDKKPIKMSYKELYNEVAQLSDSLSKLDINPGDRIVGYMPNLIETVVAMLAATSLGATWASCGAELGADAAIDRLGQITPRILFTVDAYPYKGKKFDQLIKIKKLVEEIPSIEKVVILPYQNPDIDFTEIPKSVSYYDFKSKSPLNKINFKQLPFDHPLYIMFSSGTTGKPKCMVQGAGGILINHLKELVIQTDLRRSDSLFYITSPSWMMWNWLISGLAVGATVVLYDGNPLYPDWSSLWKFVGEQNITIFGCSASYLHYLKGINAKPRDETDLTHLREISQTGSALSPEGFEFVYNDIKEDVHLNSISGGTDINGCFAGGSPNLPVYIGEVQGLALGMKVKSYDENTNPVFDTEGELVCETPSPSMPIYFWNDLDNSKYKSAYFDYYDNKKVWRHGDYIRISSKTGGVTFFGRSDATLKPSGVRIGTAEIYNVVENFDEISDSVAIGQNIGSDQRVLLFVQLNEGHSLDETLVTKIKSTLRTQASPRHVPSIIIQVKDIPYTFSGKKVESAITNIIHQRKVTNRGALRNPESLDEFEDHAVKLRE